MSIKESTSTKNYSNPHPKKKKKFDIRKMHINKKPSNKIFDIIGDIIKLPYTIRSGKD